MAGTSKKRGKGAGSKPRKEAGRATSKRRSDPAGSTAPKKAGAGRRGAAPWAARHAAKHAAEAKARNSEPPLPGSARASLRIPEGAEQIKQRVAKLHESLGRIRALEKKLPESFYELGVELANIESARLYEAKGYNSLGSFAERELDLGRDTATRLSRVPAVFREAAARQHGMDAILSSLSALDEHAKPSTSPGVPARPLKPPSGR